MADENVKKAQAYLNAMYGHRSEWIPLEENGYTGTVTVSGVIPFSCQIPSEVYDQMEEELTSNEQ